MGQQNRRAPLTKIHDYGYTTELATYYYKYTKPQYKKVQYAKVITYSSFTTKVQNVTKVCIITLKKTKYIKNKILTTKSGYNTSPEVLARTRKYS